MGFKVFEEYGAAARDEATLRISGYLFLSKGLLKRVNAEDSNGAVLLFDEDNKRIGIKFCDEYDSSKPEIRNVSKERSGVAVNILPLLKFYGMEKPEKKQTLKVSTDEDMLIIDASNLYSDANRSGEDDDLA